VDEYSFIFCLFETILYLIYWNERYGFSLNSVFKFVELSWIWIWSTRLDSDELKQAAPRQTKVCVTKMSLV